MAIILVVDDVPDFRILIKQLLVNQGFSVVEASNGTDAIAIIKSDPEIRLMLLDVTLPDIDGFAVMEELRQLRETRTQLKVAFVTGHKGRDEVIKALKLKVDDYIVKPIDPVLLRTKVNQLLNIEKIGDDFASVGCDFKAELNDTPIKYNFHITSLSEAGVTCEALNRFLPELTFSFKCLKLEEIVKGASQVFYVRTEKCEPLSKVSDRFIISASFVGMPEEHVQKIRNYAMANAPKKTGGETT